MSRERTADAPGARYRDADRRPSARTARLCAGSAAALLGITFMAAAAHLKPRRYSLIITATNSIAAHSAPLALNFTIVR